MADLTRIHQVLMNLCTNALHAMQENGGVLEVGVQDVRLSVAESKKMGLAPGGYVVLSVKDTGCGMVKEVQDRIFEPFFTTKEVGKGTGQGLSLVYNTVVEMHGGSISVDSELGQGSEFIIKLPVSSENKGETA